MEFRRNRNSISSLQAHLVFVTKYRRREFHFTNVGMGHNFSKPLSLKEFWALITIRHDYLLETLWRLSFKF